ncbi:MAG: hypothetical protein KJ007_01335 [Burkholderiales bacterium]|nr:hypothetical protein [Burkholderiales bacterium]
MELAFLGLLAAWDEFLEQTFVRYLAGAEARNGYKPTLRLGRTGGLAHSYHAISGDPSFDPARNYSRFSDPKWVIAISKIYFENGSPYAGLLHANLEILQHATKLRNRVAHDSLKSREDFKKTAKIHLGLQPGQPLRQGYSVGDLMLTKADLLFGQETKNKDLPYFMAYALKLRAMAQRICPVV